jgi:hypothetical protein
MAEFAKWTASKVQTIKAAPPKGITATSSLLEKLKFAKSGAKFRNSKKATDVGVLVYGAKVRAGHVGTLLH